MTGTDTGRRQDVSSPPRSRDARRRLRQGGADRRRRRRGDRARALRRRPSTRSPATPSRSRPSAPPRRAGHAAASRRARSRTSSRRSTRPRGHRRRRRPARALRRRGGTIADVAELLDAPLIVVARAGLGTLNHTALTVEAIERRGLRCLGHRDRLLAARPRPRRALQPRRPRSRSPRSSGAFPRARTDLKLEIPA